MWLDNGYCDKWKGRCSRACLAKGCDVEAVKPVGKNDIIHFMPWDYKYEKGRIQRMRDGGISSIPLLLAQISRLCIYISFVVEWILNLISLDWRKRFAHEWHGVRLWYRELKLHKMCVNESNRFVTSVKHVYIYVCLRDVRWAYGCWMGL